MRTVFILAELAGMGPATVAPPSSMTWMSLQVVAVFCLTLAALAWLTKRKA